MAPITIFVKECSPAVDLGSFAAQVATTLGSCTLTERESSNYAHGHYFTGTLGDIPITLYYLDTQGLEHLFAIEISAANEEVADKTAHRIATAGFSCFVPAGAWYRKSWNGEGKTYEF